MDSKQTPHPAERPLAIFLLREFFEQFPMHENHQEIWNLMLAYNSQPDSYFPDAMSRSNTTLFCSKIDQLLRQLHELWIFLEAEAAKPN
jgi:hypothetical protein